MALWKSILTKTKLVSGRIHKIRKGKESLDGANLVGRNEEHLKILEQGIQTWNEWRKENSGVWIDLAGANLANADLAGAKLQSAHLHKTNLRGADLHGAKLTWAHLRGADLQGANLARANLVKANLKNVNLTGSSLYGTSRDDWLIDGVCCDFVFWNEYPSFVMEEAVQQWEQTLRVPKNRDFRPGEFEELHKQLPTFEYYFEQGFSPLDPLIMDRVVQAINERQPEIEIRLKNFEVTGTPHATFTVLHKNTVEDALDAVKSGYEAKIEVLKEQKEEFRLLLQKAIERPQIIGRIINARRDYIEHIEGDVYTSD